jgi:hypothetical protein
MAIEGLTDFAFTLEKIYAREWQIFLETSQAISDGAQVTVSITNTFIGGDALLTNDTASGVLSSQSAPFTAEETQSSAIEALAQTALAVVVSSSFAGSLITGNMSSAWAMINNLQLIGYIPMMDLNLPISLSSFFKSMLSFNLVPNLFQYFVHDDSPRNFESARRVGVDSSLFIMNTGELFTTFLCMLMYWPVSCMLSKCSNHKVARYFYAVSLSFRWSFFIRFVIEGYIDLTFATIFQLHNATASSLSVLVNVCLAGLFMALSLTAPVVFVCFICKNYGLFEDLDQKDFRTKFGSVFDEFKNTRGLLSCSYYFLFLLRRLLYVGSLYLLEDFPLVQVVLNILHSLGTFGFLFVYQPFQESYLNISSIYAELCITLTFGMSGLFLLDLNKSTEVCVMWSTLGVVYSMILVNILVTSIFTVRHFKTRCFKWRNRSIDGKTPARVLEL